MTHRRKMDGLLRYKQTPKRMSYKYTPMEKCLRVRIVKINIDGQTETLINRIDTVVYLIKEVSGYEKVVNFTGQNWSRTKGTPKPMPGTAQKPQDFLPENMTLPDTSSSP